MPRVGGGATAVFEYDVRRRNPEREIEVSPLLDRTGGDEHVGTAGEEIESCPREVRRRIDPSLGGELVDELLVGRNLVEHDGSLHAGSERLGSERGDAVRRDLLNRAAVEAAGDHRRAHHAGRVGDVQLVRHERAGREAGDGNLRWVDGEAAELVRGLRRGAEGGQERRRRQQPCQPQTARRVPNRFDCVSHGGVPIVAALPGRHRFVTQARCGCALRHSPFATSTCAGGLSAPRCGAPIPARA